MVMHVRVECELGDGEANSKSLAIEPDTMLGGAATSSEI